MKIEHKQWLTRLSRRSLAPLFATAAGGLSMRKPTSRDVNFFTLTVGPHIFVYTGILGTHRQWIWIHQVLHLYEYMWMFSYTWAIQWPGDGLTSSVSTANYNAGLFCCHGCHLKMQTSQYAESFWNIHKQHNMHRRLLFQRSSQSKGTQAQSLARFYRWPLNLIRCYSIELNWINYWSLANSIFQKILHHLTY